MKSYKLSNLILFIVVLFIYMAPALWNGFPLVFTDTLSYLTSGMELIAPVDRPIFYGLAFRVGNLIIDLWGVIFLQSVLVISLLLKMGKVIQPNLSQKLLLIWIGLVGSCTSVIWFTSQLSADIFTSCLFLTMTILAFTCHASSRISGVFLGVLVVLEICMHSGNLILGVILFACLFCLLWICEKSWSQLRRFSAIAITSLIVSVVLIVVSNVYFHQGLTFNRWGKVIYLARVLEDGPGLQYLNTKCLISRLHICEALPLLNEAAKKEVQLGLDRKPELKNLVLNSLLWDGGIDKSGGLSIINNEASEIIFGTFKDYPIQMFKAFIRNSIDQLNTFSVGGQFGSTVHLSAFTTFFEARFPNDLNHYLKSRQSTSSLEVVLKGFNKLYNLMIVLSLIVLPLLIYFWHESKSKMTSNNTAHSMQKVNISIITLFIFLISNAMLTGGISAVFDRYQSRVIWLLPAMACLFFIGAIPHWIKKINTP